MLTFIIFFSYLCIVEILVRALKDEGAGLRLESGVNRTRNTIIDIMDKFIFVKQGQQECGDLLQGADYYIWGDMREKGTPSRRNSQDGLLIICLMQLACTQSTCNRSQALNAERTNKYNNEK